MPTETEVETPEPTRCLDCDRELDARGDCRRCDSFFDHVDAQIDAERDEAADSIFDHETGDL